MTSPANHRVKNPIDSRGLFYFVGMQGIEPCLTAPKAVVLPVYDIPFILDRHSARQVSLFKVSYFWFRINASNDIVRFALVVQWIEQSSSKALM